MVHSCMLRFVTKIINKERFQVPQAKLVVALSCKHVHTAAKLWEQPFVGGEGSVGYVPTAARPGGASFVPTFSTVQDTGCVLEQES